MNMPNEKALSDEKIIAAIISHGTLREAAEAIGVTERTVYNRMNSSEFKALYQSAKTDIVRKSVFDINRHIEKAIQTVVEVMTNEENNPAIRLQAAQTILNNAGKFAQRLDDDEKGISEQKQGSLFSFFDL